MSNGRTVREYREELQIGGQTVPVTVRLKKRMRSLRMKLEENGDLSVSAPYYVGKKEIYSFLEKNADWIIKNRTLVLENTPQDPEYTDGSEMTLMGQNLKLRFFLSSKNDVFRVGDVIMAFTKERLSPEKQEKMVREFLLSLFRQYVTLRVHYFSALTGLKCNGLKFRNMSSRWGSCTPKTGEIRISNSLMPKDTSLIDYIVLHEICHLRHANHGPDFRAMLTEYMPDWEERQKKLNKK